MRILFICKGSTHVGLGHIIRSRSLALQLYRLDNRLEIDFWAIGEKLVLRLLGHLPFPVRLIEEESALQIERPYEIAFFDLLALSSAHFDAIQQQVRLTVSISPIFNQMSRVDILFNRTKYLNLQAGEYPGRVFAGLEYTIIREGCQKISTAVYEENLYLDNFPIAISMGGGDAANKTLVFLESLRECLIPATFWVMLGEGYKHSYDKLIKSISRDSQHEIILAKTNRSMWQILKNCVLGILPGGITTYEAAYAGLPTINVYTTPQNQFLVKELEEADVSIGGGVINEENLSQLNRKIELLHEDRKQLLLMHINSKQLIKGEGPRRIMDVCRTHL